MSRDLRTIRICLAIFIAGLVLSGITAFPLVPESGPLLIALRAVRRMECHGAA